MAEPEIPNSHSAHATGPAPAEAVATEIFKHRVAAIAEEMGETLMRASYSTNIKERRDFSCAIFDSAGELVAQAAHIPVHLAALAASVEAVRAAIGDWQRGDVVLLNDPSSGGSHLPDLTTVSPVFLSGSDAPSGFAVTRAHHADVGGSAPGSMAMERDLVAEGLIIPPIKIRQAGRLKAAVLDLICANSRMPLERRGDLSAQIAAHDHGEVRLTSTFDMVTFKRLSGELIEYAERLARQHLAALGNGESRFVDYLDDDGAGGPPQPIAATVSLRDGEMHVDFAGSAPQSPAGLNAPLAVTHAAVYYVAACLVGDGPINGGTFRPLRIQAPQGSIVNPLPGAAVAGGNVETSQRIVDAVLGALASIAPDRIPAASQGTMNNLAFGGMDGLGRRFSHYETAAGGAGGGPGKPGASAIQVHMTNTLNTPIEALEMAMPVLVRRLQIIEGSGGPGEFPGGNAIERAIEMLVPTQVSILAERREKAPWGLAGGGDGRVGHNRVELADGTLMQLPGKVTFLAGSGDVVVVRTPGGGGWGHVADATALESEPDGDSIEND